VKCRIIVSIAAAVLSLGVAAPAYADLDFGPGNSSKGPNDGGQLSSPGPDGEHAWLQLGARALKHS
jgi:hypothetical protein